MAKTQYLTYYVHLDDEDAVNALNAAHPDGVNRAPYNPVGPSGMAVEAAIAAGLYPPTVLDVLDVGDAFTTNSLTSEWFTTSSTFPKDVAVFTISSGWWIFGSSTKFYWIAKFVYSPAPDGAPADVGDDSTTPAPMPVRYFVDGFEILTDGEGSVNASSGRSRAGSTTKEGCGFLYANASGAALTRFHQFPSSPARKFVWNRVYVVAKRFGSVSTEIMRITNAATSSSGHRLHVTADGKIAMYTSDGTTVSLVSVTDGQLVIGQRHRLDVMTFIGDNNATSPASPAVVAITYIWLDGVLVGNCVTLPGGTAANGRVTDISLGSSVATNSGIEIAFDDWRCTDVPDDKKIIALDGVVPDVSFGSVYPGLTYPDITAGDLFTLDLSSVRPAGVELPDVGYEVFKALNTLAGGTPHYPRDPVTGAMDTVNWIRLTDSVDYLQGSRVVLLNNVSGDLGAYTPADYRIVGCPQTKLSSSNGLVSTTSGDILKIVTDAVRRLNNVRGAQGWGAVNIGLLSAKQSTKADGSIGYKIGSESAVYTAISSESTSGAWTNVLYQPTLPQAPEAFTDVEAHYEKGADTGSSHVRALLATVDVIGIFDACDIPPDSGLTAPPTPRGLHNAPYYDTAWFRSPDRPLAPLVIKAGTYTGNGTGQDLTFPAPVHLLLIRPTSGDAGGARFFSSGVNIMRSNELGGAFDFGIAYPRLDPSFTPGDPADDQQQQFIFPIAGIDTQLNANTVVYEYIAVMDPGNRFLLCGAGYHQAYTGFASIVEALEDPDFLPLFGIFWRQDISTTSTDELWIKGPGHATASAQKSSGTSVVASAITFNEGSLTLGTGFVDSTQREGTIYALMRRDDGSGDPAVAKVFAMGSYVGDGASSRTITLAPSSGLRPLYAIVKPDNAVAIHRDPSHTGTTSSDTIGTSNASTGITAGAIDGFSVGSVLNSSGHTYNYFVILGDSAAGNGGWSGNGTFTPIATSGPATPHLTDDSATTTVNTAVTIDVLSNDIGDGLSLDSVGAPAHGAAVANFDGSITYTPDTDFVGTDTFTYAAKFTGQSETADATVTVTVTTGGSGGGGTGGPGGGGAIGCAAASTIVCNIALSRLGVNRQLTDVTTDTTIEATLARLHYAADGDTVLAAFPWEFARRYVALAVVDGTLSDPVNPDWTFSYRRPTDCVFERRIVGDRGTAINPTPPPFALSGDTDGELILTNVDAAVLEYTARPVCPASAGDPLFIEAFAWKLAASLAPALTRIPNKAEECLQAFQTTVARAYDVQRPGNPGPPAAAATIDTASAATAANLAVVNRALIRIGARTIGALTDQSREAVSARLIFEDELQATLRDFPWAFATRYEELAAVAGPVTWDDPLVQTWDIARTYEEDDVVSRASVVYYAVQTTIGDDPTTDDGTNWTTDEPVHANADWFHAYRTPADLLSARRLVKELTRRVYDDCPFPFKVGTDEGGELLYTDAEQAILEYTSRIDGAVLRGDALFKDAFAWRLASSLAPSLAQVDPAEVEQLGRGTDATAASTKAPASKANLAAMRQQVASRALQMYLGIVERAKDANANEGQDEKTGDAPWIESRGVGRRNTRRQTRAPWDN
jgi:hypothetical protein